MYTAECQSAYEIARNIWLSDWTPECSEEIADEFGIDIVLAAISFDIIRQWQRDAEVAASKYTDVAIIV